MSSKDALLDKTEAAEALPPPTGDGKLVGLTEEEVIAKRAELSTPSWPDGRNEVVIAEEHPLVALLKVFLQPMSLMLEVSMAISGFAEEWADFWIITTMLCVNALLAFYEDMKAKASVNALKSKLVNEVDCFRGGSSEDGGAWVALVPGDLVPGDIVTVRGGDAIPADCEYFSGPEIAINTAALTGETLPQKHGPGIPRKLDEKGEVKLILKGCVVHQSPGTFLRVVKTGPNTEEGKAQTVLGAEAATAQSAFEEKIMTVTMYIIILTLLDVMVVIMVQVEVRGYSFWDEIVDCLSLIIASVPVALPMVIQITMALGAAKMAEKKAIITNFPALQDIAAMTVLCSDKTGTLTTAVISVNPDAIVTYNGFTKQEVLEYAAVACGFNSEDPIDRSVKEAYQKTFKSPGDCAAALKEYNVTKVAGFTPEVKRFVAWATHPEKKELMLAKGLINKVMNTGNDEGENWVCKDIEKIAEDIKKEDMNFAKDGFKTVGVAVGKKGPMGNYVMQFAGIIPMMDPPRSDTPEVIEELKMLGIVTKMITGDHKNIAKKTAFDIGMDDNILANTEIVYKSEVLDANVNITKTDDEDDEPEEVKDSCCDFMPRDLEGGTSTVDAGLDDVTPTDACKEKILSVGGFAQVMPKDKLAIVRVFRDSNGGSITGMTGDGVNDAPALKAANVGIAVQGASAAAQQASDIILTDEGLSPIATAVTQSRMIYARLQSYVLYRMAATIQIVVVLSTMVFAFDDAMPALYVILLALLNDITMLTVSYDNANVQKDPVRPTIFLIMANAVVVGGVMALTSILFYYIGDSDSIDVFLSAAVGSDENYTHSIMYLQISLGIETMIFNCRHPKTWFFAKRYPHELLVASVMFANILVIFFCLCGIIVEKLTFNDVLFTVVYDVFVFILADIAKVFSAKMIKAFRLEEYFEGEVPKVASGVDGGSPPISIADMDPKRSNTWTIFGREVSGWISSRSPSVGKGCCAVPASAEEGPIMPGDMVTRYNAMNPVKYDQQL